MNPILFRAECQMPGFALTRPRGLVFCCAQSWVLGSCEISVTGLRAPRAHQVFMMRHCSEPSVSSHCLFATGIREREPSPSC